MKLTAKQQEVINTIKNKQAELGKKLYIVYNEFLHKTLLVEISSIDDKRINYNNIDDISINTKIAYTLLDKNLLISEPVINNIKLVTLNTSI